MSRVNDVAFGSDADVQGAEPDRSLPPAVVRLVDVLLTQPRV